MGKGLERRVEAFDQTTVDEVKQRVGRSPFKRGSRVAASSKPFKSKRLSCRCSSIAINSRTEALRGSAVVAARSLVVSDDGSSCQEASTGLEELGVGTRSDELKVASRRV